jgi:RHS repeat-associated protein
MKYYADGLRAKKQTGTNATSYVYNLAGKLVAEAKGASATAITANYIWGPDRALVKKEVGGGDYYYLYNGHGDVIQMVDRNGNVVNNYQYDEWGNILTSNETISNPFKYAGEVYDDETGLYYLRARYYDPSMGRFINEDNVEGQVNNPLTMNLYTYCYNNPLIFIDSTGNSPSPLGVALGIIGGIAGWQFGDYVAKELGCTGWKYWTVRSAVMVSSAVLGFVAGEALAPIVTEYLLANPAIAAKLPSWTLALLGVNINQETVVIGETMTRVVGYANKIDARTYSGLVNYNELVNKFGTQIANFLGKVDNAKWLLNEMMKNTKIVDIGIDADRAERSSSYLMEFIISFFYKNKEIVSQLVDKSVK